MKLCVVGTGAISKNMIPEFLRCSFFECAAICSRKEETGRAMADLFGIPTVYTSLEDALAAPEIEVVYIASPNAIHYQQTKAALLAGKHVLCEKPFAPTVAEAEELINLAKEKGLLLYETITTAHHPHYAIVKENLPRLGKLKLVSGTFCQFSSRYPALLAGKVSPVLDPAYKGGALMDINLYNIHFTVGLFGAPADLHYYPNIHTNGVDTSGILVMRYPGFVCQCTGAKDSAARNGVQIIGEDGYMELTPIASNLQNLRICVRGEKEEVYSVEENAWYYEVQDLGRLMAEGDREKCYAALETTRNVVSVLEKARLDGKLGF